MYHNQDLVCNFWNGYTKEKKEVVNEPIPEKTFLGLTKKELKILHSDCRKQGINFYSNLAGTAFSKHTRVILKDERDFVKSMMVQWVHDESMRNIEKSDIQAQFGKAHKSTKMIQKTNHYEPKFAGMTYKYLLEKKIDLNLSDSDFFAHLASIYYTIPYTRIGLHDVKAVKEAFENWKKTYHIENN